MKIRGEIAALGLALLPAAVCIALIGILMHTSITAFHPTWSDEVSYWHQALSMSQVGFANGYYSINEIPGPTSWIRYGPHGPFVPLVMGGAFGWVAGWKLWSGLLLNLLAVTLALMIFCRLAQLSIGQIIAAVVVVSLFWPLLLYVPTTMQESIHQAIAMVMAGAFSRILATDQDLGRRRFAWMMTAIVAVSLLRVTWMLMVLPLIALSIGTVSRKHLAERIITIGVLCLAVVAIRFLMSAPYPNPFEATVGMAEHSPGDAIATFLGSAWSNIRFVLGIRYGSALQTLLWLQMLMVLGLVVAAAVGRRWSYTRAVVTRYLPLKYQDISFHLLNVGSIVLFAVVLYVVGVWRDYRLYAPHLLLSSLVMVARRQYLIAGLLVLSNILFIHQFLATFEEVHTEHFLPRTETIASNGLRTTLIYSEGSDPWCNTLLIDNASYTDQLLNVPAGIGLSLIVSLPTLHYPLKSRWVLVSPESYRMLKERARLRPVAEMSQGTLYLNLDAACAGQPEQRP